MLQLIISVKFLFHFSHDSKAPSAEVRVNGPDGA